ncbi:MAG: hypothetical protein ACYDHN_12380 [Solirubrobacteraceae bacterium]
MAIIRITRPPMVTQEMYDATQEKLGGNEDPPEGLLMHSAGEVDGVWQIVDVWESEEHSQRFDRERLGPAIRETVGDVPISAPKVTSYEIHNLILAPPR